MSKEKEKAQWNTNMEIHLCELLIAQILGGNRPKSFSKQAWIEVKDEFNKKFRKNLTMEKIKNRYNLSRTRHTEFKILMSFNGFEWNPEEKKVIVDDEGVWDSYLKANPDQKRFKTNGCPIYEELCIIFNDSVASGSNAYDSDKIETPVQSSRQTSSAVGEEEDGESSTDKASEWGKRKVATTNDYVHTKRTSSNSGLLSEALFAIADATKGKYDTDLDKDPYSIPNCTKYLQSIEGMSVGSLMGALEKFQAAEWQCLYH